LGAAEGAREAEGARVQLERQAADAERQVAEAEWSARWHQKDKVCTQEVHTRRLVLLLLL
jgi:hypothetical protein